MYTLPLDLNWVQQDHKWEDLDTTWQQLTHGKSLLYLKDQLNLQTFTTHHFYNFVGNASSYVNDDNGFLYCKQCLWAKITMRHLMASGILEEEVIGGCRGSPMLDWSNTFKIK